jgi:hypothetical protein
MSDKEVIIKKPVKPYKDLINACQASNAEEVQKLLKNGVG